MKTMILGKKEIKELISIPDVIDAVEKVYKLKAEKETAVWPHVIYNFEEPKGVMDIKSGYVGGDMKLHGAKMLNTFWGNKELDIPVFSGLMMVFDSNTGEPIGMMDASYITSMRTGAAGAIGVKTLARKDSKTLFVLGAGRQAAFQIAATLYVLPQIEEVIIYDAMSFDNAKAFSNSMVDRLKDDFGFDASGIKFTPCEDCAEGVRRSDVIITITPATSPVIKAEWIKAGTHLSCIGADMAGKEEIYPECFIGAKIYTDDKEQTMKIGELEMPIKNGIISEEDVLGDIGQVLIGKLTGRTNDEESTIFDATGIALLDIVTAKIGIDNAIAKGVGVRVEI